MDVQERVRQAVRETLDPGQAPGASVAVWLDGATILAEGFGYSDLAGAAPLETNAQFYLYSVTKTILAIVLMQLAEAETLRLEDPIQGYLPDLPLEKPVTVRQLLNHTGGVPDYGGLSAYWEAVKADPGRPWTEAEFLAATLPGGMLFPPGQGWSYSNIGYLLLRKLVEQLTGLSFREALHRGISHPLGLRQTIVVETLEDAKPITPGYSRFFSPTGLEDVRARYHPGWVSHGLVSSTAPELALIFEAFFSGRLLPQERVTEMLEDPIPVPVDHAFFCQPAYGLGLMIDQGSRWGQIAGHAGGGPGYSTGALVFPDVNGRRITSIALANEDVDEVGLELAFRAGEIVANAIGS